MSKFAREIEGVSLHWCLFQLSDGNSIQVRPHCRFFRTQLLFKSVENIAYNYHRKELGNVLFSGYRLNKDLTRQEVGEPRIHDCVSLCVYIHHQLTLSEFCLKEASKELLDRLGQVNLYRSNRPGWQVILKAFSRSKNTAAGDILLHQFKVVCKPGTLKCRAVRETKAQSSMW